MKSKAFSALLWKEAHEVWRHALAVLVVFALMFYMGLADGGSAGSDPVPARHFTWYGFFTAVAAIAVGYSQASRERRGEMWAFTMHRPASGARIFGAKLVVGIAALMLAMAIPYCVAMWWLSIPGHRAAPFDRGYFLAGVADLTSALTYYAAGLYAGSHRGKWVTRGLGIGPVVLAEAAAGISQNAGPAIVVIMVSTSVLIAAAWADFTSGSDFEAQPIWGKAANVLSAIPAVGGALFIAFTLGQAMVRGTTAVPQRSPQRVEATINRLGGIVLVKTGGRVASSGAREVVAVTDMAGRPIRGFDDTTAHNAPDDDVISTFPLPTDLRSTPGPERDSYRDPGRWAKRMFPWIEKPIWYFERRHGLISLYDDQTRTLRGWLGPDGYSEGPAMPGRRFAGELRTTDLSQLQPDTFVLALSGGVYELNNLARPRLLFTPQKGETVLHLSEGRVGGGWLARTGAPWRRFRVITTTARTYVLDDSGRVELSVPHPAKIAGRTVVVYRAPLVPWAPTFLWYSPSYAKQGDTASLVLEFRKGSAVPVEHRVAAVRFTPSMNAAMNLAAAMEEAAAPRGTWLIPAYLAWSLMDADRRNESGTTMRSAISLILGCLSLVIFAFWLRRRVGLSNGQVATWTALAAFVGPVALVLVWMFLEVPPREECVSCGKLYVVASAGCRSCGARPAELARDGTEVFAI